MSILDDITRELADLKARVDWMEARINEYTGDTWKCQAELPLQSGHSLHCTEQGTHTTHRYSIEV